MKPCVYILEIRNGEYYIGSTNNINRRLKEHRLGNHAGARFFKDIELLLVQEYETLILARRIESRLKKFKSRKIINKIIKDGEIKINLGP
jgi:putative endonuclease